MYLFHTYYKPEAAIYIEHPFSHKHQAEVRAFYVCLEEISHECQEWSLTEFYLHLICW